MSKYQVVYKRTFIEFGTVVVNAADENEAKEIAKERLDEAEWTQQQLDEEDHEYTLLLEE